MAECRLNNFVPLDHGQLLVRHDLVPAFEMLGWVTLNRVLGADDLQRNVLHSDRDNCHFELPALGPEPAKRVYIKRHRRASHGATPALDEAAAADLCRSAGVPCMRIAAVGHRHDAASGDRWQSFFMSEEIGRGQSAYHRAKALQASPDPGAGVLIQQIIATVARTTHALHAAGLFHGDCHWPHFILETAPDGRLTASLIDLQLTRRLRGAAAQYAWIKDLAQLRNSMRGLRLTPAQLDYWYDCYFAAGRPQAVIPWPRRAVRFVVDARANLREWHRLARGSLRSMRDAGMWL